jgi:hypothetical protein
MTTAHGPNLKKNTFHPQDGRVWLHASQMRSLRVR